jgi:hypothetical protein
VRVVSLLAWERIIGRGLNQLVTYAPPGSGNDGGVGRGGGEHRGFDYA